MTLREIANLMRALGAREALNLDGGGSTTMVISNPKTNALEVVNRPSDATGERTVGNALAIVNSCVKK
jgi:exopolysaccharide biosynthesis protein